MQGKFPVSAIRTRCHSNCRRRTPPRSACRSTTSTASRSRTCRRTSRRSGYAPVAVGTNLLMLSALGGWLDSRGAWGPPGMSVEEWVHHATMGRDHYVRVVYKGFLFPFGHRVALVKVSERKFHNGALDTHGNQTIEARPATPPTCGSACIIVPRERELRYVEPSLKSNDGTRSFNSRCPFSSVRILTPVTPNLDRPDHARARSRSTARVSASDVLALRRRRAVRDSNASATDLDGRTQPFELPMIYMDNTLLPRNMATVAELHAAEANASGRWRHGATADAAGRRSSQAAARGDSPRASKRAIRRFRSTDRFRRRGRAGQSDAARLQRQPDPPVFYPKVEEARVRIAALAQLTGSAQNNTSSGTRTTCSTASTSNQGQVFVDVVLEGGHGAARLLVAGRSVGRFRAAEPEAERDLAPDRSGDRQRRQLHQRHR